jgi:hypothetical protein
VKTKSTDRIFVRELLGELTRTRRINTLSSKFKDASISGVLCTENYIKIHFRGTHCGCKLDTCNSGLVPTASFGVEFQHKD